MFSMDTVPLYATSTTFTSSLSLLDSAVTSWQPSPNLPTTPITLTGPPNPSYNPSYNGQILGPPSADCEGLDVNGHCVPFQVWLDIYNYAFTAKPGASRSSPMSGVSGVDIQGPRGNCDGFTVNGICLHLVDFVEMLGDAMFRASAASAKGTATTALGVVTSSPASASVSETRILGHSCSPEKVGTKCATQISDPPNPTTHPSTNPTSSTLEPKASSKLGFIAIPLILVVIALLSALFIWRRRTKKNNAFSPSPLPSPHFTNPLAHRVPTYTTAELHSKPGFNVEREKPALMEYEDLKTRGQWRGQSYAQVDEERKRRYLRNGAKIFDDRHERRARERERMGRDSVGKEGTEAGLKKLDSV